MPPQKIPAGSRSTRRKPAQRRAAIRFLPTPEIICDWSNGGAYASGRVCDISAGGACLFIRGRVEPGTELTVELINGSHTFLCARRLRVVRVYQSSGKESVVGGAFDRSLGYDELLPFIA